MSMKSGRKYNPNTAKEALTSSAHTASLQAMSGRQRQLGACSLARNGFFPYGQVDQPGHNP